MLRLRDEEKNAIKPDITNDTFWSTFLRNGKNGEKAQAWHIYEQAHQV